MISDERIDELASDNVICVVSWDERIAMAREIQAYRQAFSEPRAWVIHARGGDIITDDGHYVANAEAIAGVSSTELYRKPTIPS